VATPRASFMAELTRTIGARMEQVLIPWDCADGFFETYQRRAEAYLDDQVRRGISVWARWAERTCDLVALDAAELGLRLLVT
jgi:hypothetical protein